MRKMAGMIEMEQQPDNKKQLFSKLVNKYGLIVKVEWSQLSGTAIAALIKFCQQSFLHYISEKNDVPCKFNTPFLINRWWGNKHNQHGRRAFLKSKSQDMISERHIK